jgi:RNA polymerase sigma-70 factor (ECF subfamily)
MHEKYWEEFIHGDNQSLSKVYEPLFQPLLFIALKYVKNLEQAQDITSELFASILETDVPTRQTKWSQIRDLKAFLSTIIKCRALDYLKIDKNRMRILEERAQTLTITHEQSLDLEHLRTCIYLLPAEEQELLHLHLAGYKNDEIATQKNYAEKTVRNKLSSSRKKLIYLWKNLILVLLWQL